MALPLLLAVLLAPAPAPALRGEAPPTAMAADTGTIESRILGRERSYFVSVPASHGRTGRLYPVLVVLDGEHAFGYTADLARRLAALGHIPEAIVVGVPNVSADPRDRVRDMTPPGLSVSGSSLSEGGDRFLDFIERELLPRIAERYRGGAPAMLMGVSSGGVIATYAAATRPTFAVVVAIDAPIFLGDEWLAKRLIDAARAPGAADRTLRYVSVQGPSGWPAALWDELLAAAPGSWHLRREVVTGESHETLGFLATYLGLRLAFDDYSIVGAPIPPRAPAGRAFAHYDAIAASLGADLPPPAPVLDQLVSDLLVEGLVEPARRALEWSVRGYGDSTGEEVARETIEAVARRPPLAETVTGLLATPMPTAAAIQPFLGEWTGTHGPTEHARQPLRVRFGTRDGRATGEILQPSPDGTRSWAPLAYLRMLPDGIEFGRMNGMRPLGVWVWTARREGAALVGTAGFRGIVLPLPDGGMPPTFTFSLERP